MSKVENEAYLSVGGLIRALDRIFLPEYYFREDLPQTPEEQLLAHALCARMRQRCEILIDNYGQLHTDYIFLILDYLMPFHGLLSPIRRAGLTNYELRRLRTFESDIVTLSGNPNKLQVYSYGPQPAAESKAIVISNIDEVSAIGNLMLWKYGNKSKGEIWRDVPVGRGGLAAVPFHQATLEEARKFENWLTLAEK